MKVKVIKSTSAKSNIDMICGFVFSDDKNKLPLFLVDMFDHDDDDDNNNDDNNALLSALISQSVCDMSGKRGQITLIPTSLKKPAKRILLAGLGERTELTLDTIRHVSGIIAKKAKELKLGEFIVVPPTETDLLYSDIASAIAEGSVMSTYGFNSFKSKIDKFDDDDALIVGKIPKDKLADDKSSIDAILSEILATSKRSEFTQRLPIPHPNLSILIYNDNKIEPINTISDAVRTSVITSYGNLFVRGVANLPPNICPPKMLADIARILAKKNNLKCTIIPKCNLKDRGFGGITAVGQGSKNEPYLIILEHSGSKKKSTNSKPIVLVGKAVTFDTGGISIKPGSGMDEMKFDKCGGCTVLGIMKTVSELGLHNRVIGIIPAVENMPGGESYRPGDIIKLYSGKTAEILNTDAEGRLILADALSYGEQHYKPSQIIDFATLTGACIVALGTNVAGMISNDQNLADQIRKSSQHTSELVWELPLDQDYMDMIKSSVADMKNMGIGRAAGTIAAAAFLKNAINDDTPWVHLDIAGVAWMQTATKSRSYKSKGATGFGLRLIIDHLLKIDRKK